MNDERERRVEGVSRVVRYIARLIEENRTLKTVCVRGEVSGLGKNAGRLYFALKEGADLLNCVAWSKDAVALPPFRDGDEIIVEGDFSTYPARSQYQLQVKHLELTGIGKLYQKFEQLRRKFEAEGLFADERKRPMPRFPLRVALISARGKGAEDFEKTMAREAPHIQIRFVETVVQGEEAQFRIADSIDAASDMDVDVIVLTRGGGSYEDLFPFNEEPVVRAIVRAKRPVLTAIAHTGNLHLADYAADRVAETPSNAANYFGGIRNGYLHRLERVEAALDTRIERILRNALQRVDLSTLSFKRIVRDFVSRRPTRFADLERRLLNRSPASGLSQRAAALADLRGRLAIIAERSIERRSVRVDRLCERVGELARYRVLRASEQFALLRTQLGVLDPHAPLQRGFAMVYDGDRLLRDASSVEVGTSITARLAHGTLAARVEGIRNE